VWKSTRERERVVEVVEVESPEEKTVPGCTAFSSKQNESVNLVGGNQGGPADDAESNHSPLDEAHWGLQNLGRRRHRPAEFPLKGHRKHADSDHKGRKNPEVDEANFFLCGLFLGPIGQDERQVEGLRCWGIRNRSGQVVFLKLSSARLKS